MINALRNYYHTFHKYGDLSLICVFTFIFVVLPLFVRGGYPLHILVYILLFAYLSQSWSILGGFVGQLSIGHAAFFGVGAYTSVALNVYLGLSPWLGMVAGALSAVFVAFLFSYPTFRYGLRGPYFALATIALASMLTILASNIDFLGGAQGLLVPFREQSFAYLQFPKKLYYYYIILAFTASLLFLVHKIRNSRFGFRLFAIRENEDAAESLGINTKKLKMQAALLSASLTALGGTLYAYYLGFIDPAVLSVPLSIEIMLPAIIGGSGTLFGPLAGAIILVGVKEGIRMSVGYRYIGLNMMVYGIILMLSIILCRRGLVVTLGKRLSTRFAGERA